MGLAYLTTRLAPPPGDVEDPSQVVVGDSPAAVGDADLDTVGDGSGIDGDLSIGGRVTDGVHDQVRHHARESRGVGGDDDTVVDMTVEAHALGLRDGVCTGDGLGDEVAE